MEMSTEATCNWITCPQLCLYLPSLSYRFSTSALPFSPFGFICLFLICQYICISSWLFHSLHFSLPRVQLLSFFLFHLPQPFFISYSNTTHLSFLHIALWFSLYFLVSNSILCPLHHHSSSVPSIFPLSLSEPLHYGSPSSCTFLLLSQLNLYYALSPSLFLCLTFCTLQPFSLFQKTSS